jgi:hypothetical protein
VTILEEVYGAACCLYGFCLTEPGAEGGEAAQPEELCQGERQVAIVEDEAWWWGDGWNDSNWNGKYGWWWSPSWSWGSSSCQTSGMSGEIAMSPKKRENNVNQFDHYISTSSDKR